jgi:hypothetical protein
MQCGQEIIAHRDTLSARGCIQAVGCFAENNT